MIFFVLILFILILHSLTFAARNDFHHDYISKEKTNAIKGIFVALILLSHGRAHVQLSSSIFDQLYVQMQNHLDQMVVAMFLFYSGYGMMEQIKRKGKIYVTSIISKRFPRLLLNFDVAVTLFLILRLVLHQSVTIPNIILSFIGWESLGNSNWYIFDILVLYLITFISFIGSERIEDSKKNLIGTLTATVLSFAFVIFLIRMKKKVWWFNTVMLFPLGFWYSVYRDRIEKVVTKNDVTYYSALALLCLLYIVTYINRSQFIIYNLWGICFTMLVVLLTMKISVNDTFLNKLGGHVFSVYMLQRIPYIVFAKFDFFHEHVYLFYVVSWIALIPLVIGYERVIKKVNEMIWDG